MNFRIKEICKEKGILLKELAEMLEMSEVGLSKSLNGNPTISRLQQIATALDVPFVDLFETNYKDELTALIDHNGKLYKASTLNELEDIVKKIKEQQQ